MTEAENEDEAVKFLVGEKVYLRPIEKEDLKYVCKWVNDPEIRGKMGETLPMNMTRANEWFEKAVKDKDRVWFIIVAKETGQVIGEGGFLRIYHPWRSSDISIILGEKSAWGKGYGSEAMALMLDYGFGHLNLHRISLGVFAFNETAIRFYERAGFKREGIQREGYYYDNAYHDIIMMSILEDEHRGLYRG
jgi:RimJ/RimL family protein N-acetyltransferase